MSKIETSTDKTVSPAVETARLIYEFEPTDDRLLIDPTPADNTSESGIILDESDTGKKPTKGIVVKAGPGRLSQDYGAIISMRVREGDRVMFTKFAGTELDFNGCKLCLMREADIIGVIGHENQV